MALFTKHHPIGIHYRSNEPILPDIKHTMADLYRERHLSKKLDRGLRTVRKEAKSLQEHPEEVSDIATQIRRMLPAQGYLTERMAHLRTKAHQIRNGHIARLEETRDIFSKLSTKAKKKASEQLATAYNQMVGIDDRLERLDRSVAENEKRIRELTQKAQEYTAKYDYKKLVEALKDAEKLQHHNSKLIKIIEQTEKKLSAIAKKIASEVKQIGKQGT